MSVHILEGCLPYFRLDWHRPGADNGPLASRPRVRPGNGKPYYTISGPFVIDDLNGWWQPLPMDTILVQGTEPGDNWVGPITEKVDVKPVPGGYAWPFDFIMQPPKTGGEVTTLKHE